MAFCTEFVDVWWSWEPLHRSCVRWGWCRAVRLVVLAVVGCGCVELRRELCALCEGLHTVHTAPHNHSQHNQCRIPHAAVHGLFLLMMGIMMPETCWDRSLIINIGLVASCWFLSLHPKWINIYKYSCIWRCLSPNNITVCKVTNQDYLNHIHKDLTWKWYCQIKISYSELEEPWIFYW